MLPTNPLLNATTPAGPHLPVGLLRQYVAGTLASAAQHRVEAHTLACARCADILAGLQQTSPATTDQALTQLQQRLRQRVQQQAAPARYDHEARRNYWLIPQLAAAAALLLGLVAGGWWAWQQRYSSPAASIPAVATSAPPVAPSPEERSAKSTASPLAVPEASNAPLASSARVQASHRPVAARARSAQRPAASPPALLLDTASTAPKTQELPVAAAAPPAAAPAANASVPVDSARLAGRISGVALSRKQTALYETAPLRETAMPAAPKLPPTPVGGYSALREKLRREATEFKPEFPEQPLSGTVQLRLTIGPDGKIQQLKVLRGLRDDYDEEAQRLLCDGPGWIPGISGGKRAPLEIDIAVPF